MNRNVGFKNVALGRPDAGAAGCNRCGDIEEKRQPAAWEAGGRCDTPRPTVAFHCHESLTAWPIDGLFAFPWTATNRETAFIGTVTEPRGLADASTDLM